MHLVLFDLDHTLLAIDSDHAWGEFLLSKGLVNAVTHKRMNDAFYQDYLAGRLDAVAYNQFVLSFLVGKPKAVLDALHSDFMRTVIQPNMRADAKAAISHHRNLGHTLAVITATNRFVTGPIVHAFGIHNLIATEPELNDQGYTGNIVGKPCLGALKLEHLQAWLAKQAFKYTHITAYSDSFNDIPLLEYAHCAYAVCPDNKLRAHAASKHWPVLDWH